ncbi:MnmC family methyltransferase [Thermosynechococcaceae cyanobacterium BACA0444]|uniref:MnmC family methyltransferase n=1 Tax=Pseudocalidococcus azoricus BACA0444 TaxID=2918990 RepID=A0AAE4FSF8_9CYAN|nr:MnmC family methyltransferase [Pseudocalidococcus azoricus]MDS3861320.1 MnmC family methyltransferase [Pseudocalidococcus azoricus BACA0444]
MDILTPQLTADGSLTFFSSTFQEAFHSHHGGKQEAESKFVMPCRVGAWAKTGHVRILDICFGLGYNSAAALTEIWRVNPDCQVELRGLELNWDVPQQAIAQGGLGRWPAEIQEIISGLVTHLDYQGTNLQARLLIGDARQTSQHLITDHWPADVIFLDPFSPPHCPQLWTVEFLKQISQLLAPRGYLATYSAAAAVRAALQLAGLRVGSTPPVGRKSPGTLARWLNADLPLLTPAEQAHLQTKAAIPYRDPGLDATATDIIHTRQQEQCQSSLISTSQWRREWHISNSK